MKNTVMYMLEENALRFPDRKALGDEYGSLSYREYLSAALETAGRVKEALERKSLRTEPLQTEELRTEGLQTESLQTEELRTEALCGDGDSPLAFDDPPRCCPVGVLIDRNILSIAAFAGIAYSGNFYVPLDPALPAGRLALILQELSPLMLIDARQEAGELPVPFEGPLFTMSDLLSVKEKEKTRFADGKAEKEGDKAEAESQGIEELVARARELRGGIIDTDPLYAIFTSGSTGIPKGVLVSHRSVLDLTEAFAEVFSFEEDAVFGNQAPFDFDVSVKDIYNALHCGGCVEVIPRRLFVMPAELMEYLAAHGINTIIWAVSALRIVSDLRALDVKTSLPLRLRHVMFSGEVMPVKSVNYWMRFFPGAAFVNLYGPTEITCNCTYHILDRAYGPDEMLPIGRAFPNTRVFLLDSEKGEEGKEREGLCSLISPGEPGRRGEICVEGTGVALGYYKDAKRTRESFTEKPGAPGALNRIYRTGDMGYYNKSGELMFAARADNQIKHMGHRIELGEIEAALNAIPFIDISCCFYDEKREKIICVYQAGKDLRREIISALSDRLPKYMRPNRYIRMEKLPLNAHAKIDRRLLRELYDSDGKSM